MTQSILITTADLHPPGPFITFVNRAFEKMTGWSREEVIGKNPRLLQGPKTDHGIFADMHQMIAKGEVWSGQTINYKKDGTEFHMQWSISPVYDSQGKMAQLLAVQNDITEQVKIENQLKASRKRELERVKEIEKANIKLHALNEKQEKTLSLFMKYVPEVVVNEVLANSKRSLKKGSQLDVGLLFCDIRGYTSLAETMTPAEVVRLLDTYYAHMTDVTTIYDGVVNQFTGDEIFVTFGAPNPIDYPQVSAVRCALHMIKKLGEINEELGDILPKDLNVGIGINYGSIIASNLGSDDRLTYAVTGDAVNTAKRIESLTRDLPNTILVSESIYEEVRQMFNTKPWGQVDIKGKENKIKVYQLLQ